MSDRVIDWQDNVIYDELLEVEPATAVNKGDVALQQDVVGFWAKDREAAGEEVTLIYRCRQVLADKRTGTGEEIIAGDRLYFYPTTNNVSPTPTGVAGTDFYFCGWAKENAGANVTEVHMNWDGTRPDQLF